MCAYTSLADGTDVVLTILNSIGEETGVKDVQNSSGHIKVRTGNPPPPQDCTNPAYAVAHVAECGSCADAAYAAAHMPANARRPTAAAPPTGLPTPAPAPALS